MDKSIRDMQMSKRLLIPQVASNNNHLIYKIPRPVATKAKNNVESNENYIIDYKNVSLTMSGEISSGCIHRNNLTQNKRPDVTFIEDTEDDDEEFMLNMKTVIEKNCKMQNKENFCIRDLQGKSYLSRKKKCAFNDEVQNLMKRFKKSVDEKAPQKLQQQPEPKQHIVSIGNHCCPATYTPQITPIVQYNDYSDMNFRSNMNELFFHEALSKTQKNDLWANRKTSSENAKTITEIEIEQLIYHEMQFFTPPQKNDL